MAKKAPNQTVCVIDHDDDTLVISTVDRKWINRLSRLETDGHATELEPSIAGTREWELESVSMLRLPFHRATREWTPEQRQAVRERLAGVRDVVKTKETEVAPAKPKKGAKPVAKTTAAKTDGKVTKPTTKPAPTEKKRPGRPPKSFVVDDETEIPEDELVEDEFEDVEELEDDEEEEVIVKKPAGKKPAPAAPKVRKPIRK